MARDPYPPRRSAAPNPKSSIAPYFPFRPMKVIYHNVLPDAGKAEVRLAPDRRFRPRCGACGKPARWVHSHTGRYGRDMNLTHCQVWLHVQHRKVRCGHCRGVRVEKLDFVDTSQRVTNRLGQYAA